jgi:hypothetical protein
VREEEGVFVHLVVVGQAPHVRVIVATKDVALQARLENKTNQTFGWIDFS